MPQNTDAAATHQLSVTLGARLDTLNSHLDQLNIRTADATLHLELVGNNIDAAADKLDKLNATIREAGQSSERLALALNWLTAVAGGVAFLGVVVAALALWHHWGG